MARELGLNPRSLIKNIPSPQQQWKLPVKQWIQELFKKKVDQEGRHCFKTSNSDQKRTEKKP